MNPLLVQILNTNCKMDITNDSTDYKTRMRILVSHKDSQDNAHSRNVKWRHVYLVKNYGEAGSYCCVSRFEISEVKIRGSDQGLGPIPA